MVHQTANVGAAGVVVMREMPHVAHGRSILEPDQRCRTPARLQRVGSLDDAGGVDGTAYGELPGGLGSGVGLHIPGPSVFGHGLVVLGVVCVESGAGTEWKYVDEKRTFRLVA
jgi:hypothetical protein